MVEGRIGAVDKWVTVVEEIWVDVVASAGGNASYVVVVSDGAWVS